MAPSSRPSAGRRGRVPGQLLAEVALALLLLAALALAWPAGPPTDPERDTALAIGSSAGSERASGDRAADDMAPSRTKPLTPTFALRAPTAAPVQVLISSLNLHPRVESVGLDRSGAMAVPRNYFDVGWYNGGPVPGDPGDAVIDGHAGYPDQPLVFAKLVKFRPGDKIVVVLADGSRRDFMVDSVRSWPARAHPTGLFDPYGPARLSLITCTGQFNDKRNTYADRLVVEAHFLGIEGEALTS
jgi:hypothetical protein